MIKISIIIPVYNVEKYVEKCLRSCAEQDLPSNEFEIIVINDGTQDNSLEIVNNVACNYNNIRVFSQENTGLSGARNKGLSLAKGEYVWFVDSDDWIQENCLKTIYDKVEGYDLLAMGLIRNYESNSKLSESLNHQSSSIKNGHDLLKTVFLPQIPTYIYNRSFLLRNDLMFYEGIFHEDNEFTPRVIYYANKVKVLKESFYYAYKREGSITTQPNPKKAFDSIIVAESLSLFCENIEKEFQDRFNQIISGVINNALSNTYEMSQTKKNELNKFIFQRRYLFKHLRKSSILKYKVEGFLFTFFPKNTVSIYQYIQKINT